MENNKTPRDLISFKNKLSIIQLFNQDYKWMTSYKIAKNLKKTPMDIAPHLKWLVEVGLLDYKKEKKKTLYLLRENFALCLEGFVISNLKKETQITICKYNDCAIYDCYSQQCRLWKDVFKGLKNAKS